MTYFECELRYFSLRVGDVGCVERAIISFFLVFKTGLVDDFETDFDFRCKLISIVKKILMEVKVVLVEREALIVFYYCQSISIF